MINNKPIELMTPDELKTEIENGNLEIRKLIPKECYRLMGFTNEDFERAEKVNANSQLYKQAGNSICVCCLEGIFGMLFEGKEDHYKRWQEVRYNDEMYED